MPQIPVVEPSGNPAYPNAKSIASAAGDDWLFFPHVDSCLAIVFVLGDASVVGAHVGMFSGEEPKPDENARAAVKGMLELAGTKKILNVFTLGETEYDNRANF